MLIYIFAEHYPSPYKPQFDTEFAFLLRQGHAIRIFAGGRYMSTVHERVREYGLDHRTSLIPTTLKTLPRFILPLSQRVLRSPYRSLQQIRAIHDPEHSWKETLLRAARMLLLPQDAPDICYVHNLATAVSVDFLRRRYPSSRVVMYFHGGEVAGVKRINRDAKLFGDMDVVFANTNFARNQTIERGCPPDRAIVQPVTFDLADYPAHGPKRYREGGLLRLISVGRLSEEKGYVHSLNAVAQLVRGGCRELRYTIVGSGRQREFLQEYIRRERIEEYVRFVGERDKRGVVAELQQADVLILPSLITPTWAETQACVVQEAMFMRLLVITTRAGGVPESIADEMQQFSVPPGDSVAIADKIKIILSLPEADVLRLGEQARQFTVEHYNVDTVTGRLVEYAIGNNVREPTSGQCSGILGRAAGSR